MIATSCLSVPLFDLKAQYAAIRDEIRSAIDNVVESQQFILGPEVEKFEREVAAYSQCAHGIGVSSGTDALLVSLMAIDLRPGDEVITTPFTFFATAGAIARLGGKPVFADIDPRTYTLSPAAVERAITSRTRAIIPVHMYGQMSDMDPLLDIAGKRGLYVIEDSAQAIGAEYRGRRAGSIGHLGCLSFFPSKNLGGYGDGGMVLTSDDQLAERIRLLRTHGYRRKYYNELVGGNFRLDALQAAVLRVKLRYLDGWIEARQRNVAAYRQLFRESGLVIEEWDGHSVGERRGIVLPAEVSHTRHTYHLFVVRVARRDAMLAWLKEHQIGTGVYYPAPLHLQKCFAELGYRLGDLPVTEHAADETLALPLYPELTKEQIAAVALAVRTGFTGSPQ